jgi:DNA-binding transcriptional LysR family regulator
MPAQRARAAFAPMPPPIAAIDLNLLRVLVQIHRDRTVSRAAEHLGMSQPAVSSALKRLRAALGDKLFVPTARGMQPTPLADQLVPEIEASLARIVEAVSRRISFDPATSARRFTIAMTDIGECHFMPGLLQALRADAPGIDLATVRNTAVDLRHEMERGQVDLALGHLPALTTDFHQRHLFMQRYVCLFRRGHALDAPAPSRTAYADAEHAVVVSAGTGHGRVDEILDRAVPGRRVRVRVPHFVALADLLESSDLVATVPEVFAQRSARHFALAYRPHPIELPPIEIRMFWHAKHHDDPAIGWLRELIVRRFAAR